MEKATNPTTQASRRYHLEFALSMTAYAVVLCASVLLFIHLRGVWQILVALLPLIPVGFLFAAFVRFLRRTDEFQRQIIVISLALAGGATALLSLTYGILESFRILPHPSAWLTWMTFMFGWAIASVIVRRRFQ